ncbi:P-loop containing nucleoside triphosphate hydrolase protein [Aspergillus novoparasiticus]|uniref:P-loop containing nucleoside triphosphate hydrolase protein n=1 Tax=Aspergillus novoparasiticus TaxID=986946 RepID=A0A5N6EXT2_9EURO|nr:P-loop containing nucleoside triphosphate hydrolase protein [Aspergillus novoparasiticus]
MGKLEINLAVIGDDGFGKSALISKLASLVGAPDYDPEGDAYATIETPKYICNLYEVHDLDDFSEIQDVNIEGAIFVLSCGHTDGVSDFHSLDNLKWVKAAKQHGVPKVIVALNKMDVVNYAESRYMEVVKDCSNGIRRDYRPPEVPFVPVDCTYGTNLINPSPDTPWYKGWYRRNQDRSELTGRTLVDAIDVLEW